MVDDLEQLDADLGAIVEKKIDLSLIRPAVQLPISVPLVNLVPATKIQSIRGTGCQNAVGYLEGLTGLRYYLVTTFVIDKLDRRRPKKISLPDKRLRVVIDEMLNFLKEVCIAFHLGRLIHGETWPDSYRRFSCLEKES